MNHADTWYHLLTDLSLDECMPRAMEIRKKQWGLKTTFSKKIFIPLTRLCRDRCGYCAFVQKLAAGQPIYLNPDEVIELAQTGKKMGCKEALFSSGDKPEKVYPEALAELKHLGHSTTIGYMRELCERVLKETGLIPHVNPGQISREDIEILKPVSGSMGMMLETVSNRLMKKGMAHHGCPDKSPALRLKSLSDAGECRVPFTTGILIGIDETREERIESLVAIQKIYERYGHIQEVIIQNFCPHTGTRFENMNGASLEDTLWTLSAARIILDPRISVQVPPNLRPETYAGYLRAGINDWGGISPLTPDHINPGKPWPDIETLRRVTREEGLILEERLSVYPEFMRKNGGFLTGSMKEFIQKMNNELPR